MNVTQIALKNFAWNIAFQYNISGDLTARFVIATFNEWFSNTSFATVRKNLRTTTGRHVIEIDENILWFCSEKKNKAVGWDNAVCKKQFSLRGLALYMC